MKKVITLLLLIAMVFSLVACTKRNGDTNTALTPTGAAVISPTIAATSAPTQGAGTNTSVTPTQPANNKATPTGANTAATP